MATLRWITRSEFCKLANVSEKDPLISVWLGGEFIMPLLGVVYVERKDDDFVEYYVKYTGDKERVYKFMFRNDPEYKIGNVYKWTPDTHNKFGGTYKYWKKLER